MKIAFWLCLAIATIEAFISKPLPDGVHVSDKLLHVFGVMILAILADIAFRKKSLKIAAWIFGYAVLVEIIQYFISYRTFSLSDICADVLGIVIYLILKLLLEKWRIHKTPSGLRPSPP